MAFFILLSMIFLQIHAADDNTLVVMRQRLKDAEAESIPDDMHKFVYSVQCNGSLVIELPLAATRRFMEDRNVLEEFDYLRDVAASKKLCDKRKLSQDLVCTNYFRQLAHQEQKVRDTVLEKMLDAAKSDDYSVMRVSLAAALYTKPDIKVRSLVHGNLLNVALRYDDTTLVEMALQYGADPNEKERGTSIISGCKSPRAAQLMINKGADVAKASWGFGDLIYHICFSDNSCDNELLRFYLERIPLCEKNEYGRLWMRGAANGGRLDQDLSVDRIELLLEYDCKYDKEIKQKICDKVGEKPELKEKIEWVFANHEEPGEGIKGAD